MSLLGSLALGGTAAPALADGEEASGGFSGYVTLTSDYRFRGISQSDRDAALQADVKLAHESGLFLELWASNVDFSSDGDGDTNVEVDLTVGYETALTDLTDFSIKGVYYAYMNQPSGADLNYWEAIAALSRKLGKTTLSLEVAYTPEYADDGGAAWAGTAGLSAPLWQNVWFFDGIDGSAHLGTQGYDEATDDYTFWDLGLTANYGSLAVDARYVDTDLEELECGISACEAGFVFSATFAWGN